MFQPTKCLDFISQGEGHALLGQDTMETVKHKHDKQETYAGGRPCMVLGKLVQWGSDGGGATKTSSAQFPTHRVDNNAFTMKLLNIPHF